MATQEQRKAETRQRLLDAAALLFAERGIEAVSIDAIAEAADRTSGAVYAHFGNKDGLLQALVEILVNETAAVMDAELSMAVEGDDQLAALWQTFANPPPGPEPRLDAARARAVALRRPPRRGPLAPVGPLRGGPAMTASMRAVAADDSRPPRHARAGRAALLVVLLGLEMQHRLDPDAVPDDAAVVGLRAHRARPKPKPTRRRVGPDRTPQPLHRYEEIMSLTDIRPAGRHLGRGVPVDAFDRLRPRTRSTGTPRSTAPGSGR